MLLIRDNSRRAKEVIIFFWIYIAANIISIIARFYQYSLINKIIASPADLNMDEVNRNDQIQQIISILSLAVGGLLAIFFIRWFRRAYFNLHALPVNYASFQEGWAAGSWFVPFLNLIRPYQIMRETWEGTQQFLAHRLPTQSSSIVVSWWVIYLGSNIFSTIAAKMMTGAADMESLRTNTLIFIVSEVVSIGSAVVAMIMVSRMGRIENELLLEAQTPSDSIFAVGDES